MTDPKIIAAAKEVGMQGMLTDVVTTLDELEHFWAIAVEHGRQLEREECAVAAWLHFMDSCKNANTSPGSDFTKRFCAAEAIRARRTK